MKTDFICKKFQELTLDELYMILRIRSEVFIVEQDCVYQDLDGNDQAAVHIFAKESVEGTETDEERIIAAMRVFVDGDGDAGVLDGELDGGLLALGEGGNVASECH